MNFTQTSVQTQHFNLNLFRNCKNYSRPPLCIPNVAQWYSSTFTELCFFFFITEFNSLFVEPCCRCLFLGCEQLSQSEERNCKKWAPSALIVRHILHVDIWGLSRSTGSSGVWKAFIIRQTKLAPDTRMQRWEAQRKCKNSPNDLQKCCQPSLNATLLCFFSYFSCTQTYSKMLPDPEVPRSEAAFSCCGV